MESRIVPVGKGNIETIEHDGDKKLTVTFKSSMAKYEYQPVSVEIFEKLSTAAAAEGSEQIKEKFKEIKDNPEISYKKL